MLKQIKLPAASVLILSEGLLVLKLKSLLSFLQIDQDYEWSNYLDHKFLFELDLIVKFVIYIAADFL